MENKNKKSPLKIFGAIGTALGFGAKSGIMSLNPALAGRSFSWRCFIRWH